MTPGKLMATAPNALPTAKVTRPNALAANFAMSLDEIAREMGLSRERVYQIEKSALAKLRLLIDHEGLRDQLRGHLHSTE